MNILSRKDGHPFINLIFSILLATEIPIVAALSSNISIKNPQNGPLL